MKKFAGDIIILQVYQKSQYDVWFLRYGVRQTEFLVSMDCFLPFYPPYGPRKSKFWKNKKTFEDIVILQMFTINESCDIWFFRYRVPLTNFFLPFWTVFCPFTPLTTPKIKILKNWKKPLEISSFYSQVYQKSWSYAILFP